MVESCRRYVRRHPFPASYRSAPPDQMCQVCTVVTFQFLHFGAFVCNRCRAFFRRAVRKIRRVGRVAGLAPCLSTKQPLPEEVAKIALIEDEEEERRSETAAAPVQAEVVCNITLFRGACQPCRSEI